MLASMRKYQWEIAGSDTWATYAAAKQAAKEWSDRTEGGAQGKWRTDPKYHGVSGDSILLVCNAHTDCPFRQLVKKCCDGVFRRFTCGEHAAELNMYKRKNAVVTQEQEAYMRQALNGGMKPAGMRCSMTVDERDRLKKAGEIPEEHKRKDGGLLGALQTRI